MLRHTVVIACLYSTGVRTTYPERLLKDWCIVFKMQLLLLIFARTFSQLCTVLIKQTIFKYRAELIGMALGALGGLAYWFFVGCESGTCAITSSPINSSIYGAIMGALLLGMFTDQPKKEKNN
jgi:hypothetical protein